MKKKNIITISLLAVMSVATGFSASACSSDYTYHYNDGYETVDYGKYGTYYEIFPYSYADSNKDGIGDIPGITAKLDYIHDLGFNGIWLTPVHPSTTYHKYNVDDYFDIDPDFGTLDDYKEMVDKAHDLGMTVILDLVVNHSGRNNPWFTESAQAHVKGDRTNKYYDYYVWSTSYQSGYNAYNSTWYYECEFDSQMPDLNLQLILDDPTCDLAQDLTEVMRFWLEDYDVDGFRLDAVTTYFGNSNVDNDDAAVLKWINDTAKSIKPDCYIVAEGQWGSTSSNATLLQSGIDSCFNFDFKGTEGYIGTTVNTQNATNFQKAYNNSFSSLPEGCIPAPFVCNHDSPSGRLVGATQGRGAPQRLKFGYGLLAMSTGCIFNYYGDEIGMGAQLSSKDEDLRVPMNWGDKYTCTPVSGASTIEEATVYPFGTVKSLLKDDNSSLAYVAHANKVRNSYLAIPCGDCTTVYSDTNAFQGFEKTYGEDSVLLLINASLTEPYTYVIGSVEDYTIISDSLICDDQYELEVNGTSLVVPPESIVIMTKE
ncbi:MAG: hypothetical protein LUB56_01405 [Coprobacillus sp.]|nr:hypothetical protein [Coprobacillus sp.]